MLAGLGCDDPRWVWPLVGELRAPQLAAVYIGARRQEASPGEGEIVKRKRETQWGSRGRAGPDQYLWTSSGSPSEARSVRPTTSCHQLYFILALYFEDFSLFQIDSWPLGFYAEAFLCWIVFPFLRFSWSPSDLHHGLWRHLLIHVFCLVLAGQALVVPLLFFLCCCLAMLLTSKSRLHFWGFCVQFCLTVVHRSARQVKHQWILQANSVYLCISSGSPWFSLLWLTIIAQTWKVSLQVTLFLVLTGHTHTAFMNSPGPTSENEVWLCICGRVWRPRKARAHHIPWCSSEL
jgi:hypothetical protein